MTMLLKSSAPGQRDDNVLEMIHSGQREVNTDAYRYFCKVYLQGEMLSLQRQYQFRRHVFGCFMSAGSEGRKRFKDSRSTYVGSRNRFEDSKNRFRDSRNLFRDSRRILHIYMICRIQTHNIKNTEYRIQTHDT